MKGASVGIRRDYAGPVVLSKVARGCGLSMRHFQHAFGFSPQEFLMKTRVIVAMKLLEETRLSASEVAIRCVTSVSRTFATSHHSQSTLASPETASVPASQNRNSECSSQCK